MKKRLTIIAPAFNEADNIGHFYEVLSSELSRLAGYESSVLFVDDGSTDNTYQILQSIAAKDRSVQIVRFSRNFGHQVALLAGMDHADGDAVITMDADMQHPPALIPKLLLEYEKGNDVIFTFREEADDVGFLRKLLGTLFYRIVNLVSDVPIQRNASEFRLISRRVAELFKTKIRERNMFMRGMMSWVGFKQSSVRYKAADRFAGESKYSLSANLQLAAFGIISFSKKPLRAAALMGVLSAFFGFVFAAITTVQYFSGTALVPGWATVIVLISIFGGIQLVFLGVIGEYIGSIFDEVKGRPQYVVSDTINITR